MPLLVSCSSAANTGSHKFRPGEKQLCPVFRLNIVKDRQHSASIEKLSFNKTAEVPPNFGGFFKNTFCFVIMTEVWEWSCLFNL